MTSWKIPALTEGHSRTAFACGQPTLDRFLKESARQNQDKGMSRTFVLLRDEEVRVYGYYTLSGGQVNTTDLPPKTAKKLPKYPVPVAMLGRLAVDSSVQGMRLGELLLIDAIHRTLAASELVGMFALVVDALNDRAAEFYTHYGFERFPDRQDRLYLPLAEYRNRPWK
ncbi:MAG TPA: GNAT family N-acetyltransferase [Urbifossiella sp.]|nr:GNAT family N-acetyltransferase [Urbifossiella sp.]